jgi:hypothetical protein
VWNGLEIKIKATSNLLVQVTYYNGWKMDQYLYILFVFASDGKIMFCMLTALGSLRDSTMTEWSNLYQVLNAVWKIIGGKFSMDSAFASKNNPAVIRSSDYLNHASNKLGMLTMIEATLLRQSAE